MRLNELIPSVDVPEGQSGVWKIERKHIKPDPVSEFRSIMKTGRSVPEGEYTFLYRGGTLVMSDTPDEKRDHTEAVLKAKGHCLIAGLGIGMVLNAMAIKKEVERIDVVELSQDVIDLVSGHYEKKFPGKINFINDSIFDYKPKKNSKDKYNVVWFDIWDNLCTDNLQEMGKLHRIYGQRANWKGSWGKEFLMDRLAREKREDPFYNFRGKI